MLRFRCGPVHTRWAWAVGVVRGLTSRAARHSPLATLRSRGLRWHAWMVARRVQWSPVSQLGTGPVIESGHGSTSEVLVYRPEAGRREGFQQRAGGDRVVPLMVPLYSGCYFRGHTRDRDDSSALCSFLIIFLDVNVSHFGTSGQRSCAPHRLYGAAHGHPSPTCSMPPRRPQLQPARRPAPAKCHTRDCPHALSRPWLSPLSTFSDRHTRHALPPDHTAQQAPKVP